MFIQVYPVSEQGKFVLGDVIFMSNQEERQSWSSRLAYVMTVAGATVGFGATWRFPYLVG